ncbi:putative GABA permease [Xylaria longipes]|nr:putative GABA permease [Xylaria longipes]
MIYTSAPPAQSGSLANMETGSLEENGVLKRSVSEISSHDDATLARLGKKPVLKRNFGFMTILGFSCTVLITWEGSLTTILTGLQNGGPSGLLYGFIVVWAGTLSVFATLSELVSMAPTSGGQYHWVSMLAPSSCRKFLGYLTGWLAITGWQALVASGGFVTGTMIQGLILLTHPEYANVMKNWHGTLLLWAVVLISYGINTAVGSLLAKFEGLVLVLHILGFFAVVLPLSFLSPHGSAKDVFDTWANSGLWQTQGLSFSVGIIGSVFAFLGGDCAIHMSEEIRNAAMVVPRSLMTGLAINGTLGFAMMVATLYALGDIDVALAENPQYPFMSVFRHAVGSTAGATVMSALVVVMSFSATTGCLASTSRIYWAFARDRALPGWKVLKKISPRTSIPEYAVMVTVFIAIILSIVNIGHAAAFNGVISISIAGLFGSYLIAACLLLYRRVAGDIHIRHDDDSLTNTTGGNLTWGPWRLHGVLGIANNAFSCAYLTYILFFSFWPPFKDVTPETFNWAILVFGTVVSFSVLYYMVWARKIYTGPVVETGH